MTADESAVDVGDRRGALDAAARHAESRAALTTCALVGLVVALLGGLAWTKGTTDYLGPSGAATMWVPSVISMAVLLVALQLVSSLLVHEHFMEELDDRTWWRGHVGLWLLRLAITALVLAAVWWSRTDQAWWGWVPDHGDPGWQRGGAGVVVLEAVLAGWVLIQRRIVGLPAQPEGLGDTVARTVVLDGRDRAGPTAGRARRLSAIGASGGGIRAAAFVLGGHQAVQEHRERLRIETSDDEPAVFAVSGGNYMASALALRRQYAVDGAPRPAGQVTPWADSYATGSAELQWLRRHTRYLFEPGARLRDGLVTLLLGAAVNIFLAGVALRFVAWLSSQLSVMLGFVQITRLKEDSGDLIGKGEVVGLSMRVSDMKVQLLGFPVLCLLLVGALTLATWWAATRFDSSSADAEESRGRAAGLLRLAAVGRPVLLILAAVWLVLTFLLPGATTGATQLAAANQPTTKVASLLTGLGLVDEHICRGALLRNLRRAEVEANQLAAINPGVAQTVTGGACGTELEITRTAPAADAATDPDEPAGAPADGPVVTSATVQAMHQYVDTTGRSTRVRAAGVGVLLTLVAGLLQRGAAAPTGPPGRFAAIRRRVVTWLPLAIMAVLAAYLAVLWSGGLYVHLDGPGDSAYLLSAVLLTVIACLIAFIVDANVTSLHRYYRSGLSNAFAVGVDGEGDDAQARELPPEKVFRFSDLAGPDSPRLHVIATLNTQKPGEAPTLRRGYPIVFSGGGVSVYRYRDATPVPMADYERYAGEGRVSIMATAAISGAAVSPIMGRFNEQAAPFRMLLALFNLRLGTWTRNPAHTPGPGTGSRAGGGVFAFLWLTTKPGLAQMALEAGGKSSADDRWVYLSDGGHLDNTALVECVRHTGPSGRVIVLEASNDPANSWAAIGDAIAVVKADLDVDLEQVDLEPDVCPQLTWARRYQDGHGADGLDVLVVKAARVRPPEHGDADDEEPDAAGLWDRLPPHVQSFLRGHPDFPRAATARQKFGDLEFEAYRALGHAAACSALERAGWLR